MAANWKVGRAQLVEGKKTPHKNNGLKWLVLEIPKSKWKMTTETTPPLNNVNTENNNDEESELSDAISIQWKRMQEKWDNAILMGGLFSGWG